MEKLLAASCRQMASMESKVESFWDCPGSCMGLIYRFIRIMFKYLLLLLGIPFFALSADEKMKPIQNPTQQIFDTQDMPRLIGDNPLKGFTDFLLIPLIPASSKTQADKISALVKKELMKYGNVSNVSLTVNTDKGEAIDFSQFNTGNTLVYEIKNVMSLNGKELPFVRATLNLRSNVTIDKTKQNSNSYIWSSSCFLPGKTQKDIDALVSQSLDSLLQRFAANYSSVNTDKPLFKLYSP